MEKSPGKLSHFWQELKRRKVIKTLAMYAGAAYVLIELANNVVDPLQLPVWTPRLVIMLIVIGFPVVAVLSWIFDITPEGIKKTEKAEEDDRGVDTSGQNAEENSPPVTASLLYC